MRARPSRLTRSGQRAPDTLEADFPLEPLAEAGGRSHSGSPSRPPGLQYSSHGTAGPDAPDRRKAPLGSPRRAEPRSPGPRRPPRQGSGRRRSSRGRGLPGQPAPAAPHARRGLSRYCGEDVLTPADTTPSHSAAALPRRQPCSPHHPRLRLRGGGEEKGREWRRGDSRPHLQPLPRRRRPLPQPRTTPRPHLPAPSERNRPARRKRPPLEAAARLLIGPLARPSASPPEEPLEGGAAPRRAVSGSGERKRRRVRPAGWLAGCDVRAASLLRSLLTFFFFLLLFFSPPRAFLHSHPLPSFFFYRNTLVCKYTPTPGAFFGLFFRRGQTFDPAERAPRVAGQSPAAKGLPQRPRSVSPAGAAPAAPWITSRSSSRTCRAPGRPSGC